MFQHVFPSQVREQLDALESEHGRDSMQRFWQFARGERAGQHLHQRMCKHIFPGLTPATGWFDISQCAGLCEAAKILEAAHPSIRDELSGVLSSDDSVLVQYETAERSPNPRWKAMYFYSDGEPQPEAFERFPRTAETIVKALSAHRYPLGEVHFSILEAGGHINPHVDPMNITVSFHLAVIIPPDCGLRVGDETREWSEGRCLLFDHSLDHEAWNKSAVRRVSLIADVWNPELTEVERKALLLLFRWLHDEFSPKPR